MEEWRAVPGYEGLYEVSNKGNVRNVRRNKLLRLPKTNNRYIRISLCKNGIKTGLTVHRLVAEAFLPNPDNLPEVNHKDEDKTNNRVENLEFCDRSYNINYGSRNIRVKETAIKKGYWSSLSKKEYRKKYYEDNKNKLRDRQRRWYQENKDNVRSYYQKNRDRICEQQKEYRRKRKEQIQNNL